MESWLPLYFYRRLCNSFLSKCKRNLSESGSRATIDRMTANLKPVLALLNRCRSKGWFFCATILLSLTAGSLVTARLMHLEQVRADNGRVFQLIVYLTLPGKVPELEAIFRDVSKLQTKHNLSVVGYWVPTDDPAWANTLIYLVAHPSQAEAKKNWDALHADPDFPQYRKQAAPLIERAGEEYKVDEVFMPSQISRL